MDKELLKEQIDAGEADSIVWYVRTAHMGSSILDPAENSEKGFLRASETTRHSEFMFYQHISIYKGDAEVVKSDWPLGTAGRIDDMSLFRELEKKILRMIRRHVIIPGNNYLNLILEETTSRPLPRHDYLCILGRSLGCLDEFGDFKDNFRRVGCWDYEAVRNLVDDLSTVFLNSPEMVDDIEFCSRDPFRKRYA